MLLEKQSTAKRTYRQRKALSSRKLNTFIEYKLNGNFIPHFKYKTFKRLEDDIFLDSYMASLVYGDRIYPADLENVKNNDIRAACDKFKWDVSTTLSIIPALIFRNKIRVDFLKGNFIRFFPPSKIPHVSEFLKSIGAVDNGGDSFYNALSIMRFYGMQETF